MHFSRWRAYPRLLWLCAVGVMIALDQLTKVYFAATIPFGSSIEVTSWFNLVHALNEGAAFSLFADAGGWQRWFFITVGILVVAPITLISLFKHAEPLERLVGALIVAGGTGNLIDRMFTGAVTDFLDLHWRGLHWPAFNLADVFIVLAVIGWGLMSLPHSPPKTRSEP
nr:signal peptidase II [Malikia granosa]